MKLYKTERRQYKIESVAKARQKSVKIVLENIHDPHNVSAIFRTCDAVGVPKVSLIYSIEKFPKIGKKSSASAFKWVDKEKFKSVKECYESLKLEGFSIYASSICENSVSVYDLDFTGKVAIVLGNEHRGVSDEAAEMADRKFIIPMNGMVQSLNVSVAAAVILYEIYRQRRSKGLFSLSEYTGEELEDIIEKWSRR